VDREGFHHRSQDRTRQKQSIHNPGNISAAASQANDNLTVHQAIQQYSRYHLQNKSTSYQAWSLARLQRLANTLGPNRRMESITLWHLELWLTSLHDQTSTYSQHPFTPRQSRPLATTTIAGHVRAVKGLWSWLGRHRLVDTNPAALLQSPNANNQPPRRATNTELQTLLAITSQDSRDHAIINLLATTGIRAAGLVSITIQDLQLDRRFLTVTEKGRKTRTVVLTNQLALELQSFTANRQHQAHRLFTTQAGRPLSTRTLRAILFRRSQQGGLTRIVTPHMLRHRFGYDSTRRRLPLRALQLLMGHSSPTTTEIYSRLQPTDLRDAFDRMDPPYVRD